MRDHPRRLLHRLGAGLAFALALSATYSCSLLVEHGTQQCQKDADCEALGGTTCDVATHLCRGGATSSSASGSGSSSSSASGSSSSGGGGCDVDGGIDGGGCYDCAATTNEEFLDHCTTASCKRFDRTRLKHLTAGGGLPPLPTPDAGDGG